jgi:protein involved in polysaccharide export with SLBB domain
MDHIVGVFGGIKIPGDYEFVRGESLSHIIKLAGGLRPDADPNKIQITRFTSPTEKYSFSTRMVDADTTILSPEDHIMIRYEKDYKRQDVVYILGEVKYPGVYAIKVGNTTIGQVLEKAGGYTSKADKTKLFINNTSIEKIPDREKNRILIIPEENRSAEERAYIKARMLTRKGTIKSTSLEHAQILLNLNVTKNDNINIPENFNYIEVLGAVLKPGRYPFLSKLAYGDYVELAGGLTETSTRKRFIIKAGTGQRLLIRKMIPIENGDTIFIPDKLEYNRWIFLKDILTALGNVAAVIVVIQSAIGP